MHKLDCTIADGLWKLLQDHCKSTKEPVSLTVSKALGEYLHAAHHTLYQVSTSTALVQGIYQGAVRVGTLRQHGDFGLGTFENLDGEMAILDGHVYQIRGDGSIQEASDEVLSPFAAITTFVPDLQIDMAHCPAYAHLLQTFDGLRDSENIFYALRVDGLFDTMHTRAVYKTESGTSLTKAAAVQPEFYFNNVSGTLIGFWTPEYARTLSVTGYHLHFLSDDRSKGGHVLGCSGSALRLRLQRADDIRIALPETEGFLKADLRRDSSADLAKAEGTQ